MLLASSNIISKCNVSTYSNYRSEKNAETNNHVTMLHIQ